MINTFSIFYYGFDVDSTNNIIDFDEVGGSSGLQAEINTGSFSLTSYLTEIKTAMDAAGTGTYEVSVDRDTRLITIAGPSGGFSLLTNSGAGLGSSAWNTMGYSTGMDKTGATGYTGDDPAGSAYEPQFKLQDWTDEEDFRELIDASVNKSASGKIETIAFGTEKFFEFSIQYITNYDTSLPIKSNTTGVEAARDFMRHCTNKRPVEFMEDIDTRSSFTEVILSSTPQSQDGTGYKLKELYDRGLPGYYETGVLKFRVIE